MPDLENEIEHDLRTNPKYLSFFAQYNKSSIDNFIDFYKKKKAGWLTYGKTYLENEQYRILKYNEIAEQKLWEIQQVKLFDTQCLWRAEQITIPEIKTSYDFLYWEKVIETCPFLSPISENEFNLYREYILTEDSNLEADPFHWTFDGWQEYNTFKSLYQSDDDSELDSPEWYLYYNNMRCGNPCLQLPDIRGEKEGFYRNLYFNRPEVQASKNKFQKEMDHRPYFYYDQGSNFLDFLTRFEERKVIEYAKIMNYVNDRDDDDELDSALETLKKAEERVEIDSTNDDWRTAIIKTANLYTKRKIYAALEDAYCSYLRWLKLGIAFKTHQDEKRISNTKIMVNTLNESIITGRMLNNEPADFNF
ncbi:MAG: hypothetical protein M0P61_06950 [Ignavibacteriaceae bacterium]|nr:hypothetical protein [Ignavibacteriaceae bacterium]